MNQEQVKSRLLRLEPEVEDFSLVFSGKTSKKVHGLYYPDRKEIVLHNRNFTNDNELMYTAIHEFAHHVHFTRSAVPPKGRPHTTEFRSIFHELLERATELGVYESVFEHHPDFASLTRKIREQFLTENGKLMKELGALLRRAEELCREHHARFEDYIERVLKLDRHVANTLIRINQYDVRPELGYHNMKTVAGIKNEDRRKAAEQDLLQGKTPDMVKAAYSVPQKKQEQDPVDQLFAERERIQRSIESLQERLTEIEARIDEMRSL